MLWSCSVRKQEDADDILEEVGGLEGEFTPLVFDVTDAEAVKAAAAKVEAALEGSTLTALINNAGKSRNALQDLLQQA